MDTVHLPNLGVQLCCCHISFDKLNIDVCKYYDKKAYHLTFVNDNMGLAPRPEAVAGSKPVFSMMLSLSFDKRA